MEPIQLLVQDAEDLVFGALLGPLWGIYLNGTPVIQPATIPASGAIGNILAAIDSIGQIAQFFTGGSIGTGAIAPSVASTIDFEFAQDWPLSNYPQEQGGFQTYNKVTLPFDVKVKLASGGSQSDRQAFLQTVLAIANSFGLFDIMTPELTYASVNCTHVEWRRTAKHGFQLIQVDLWFEQVNEASSTTYQNTATPNIAGPLPAGNVQTQTPSQYVQSEFASGNYTVQ